MIEGDPTNQTDLFETFLKCQRDAKVMKKTDEATDRHHNRHKNVTQASHKQ
jgi:hypothetical protein